MKVKTRRRIEITAVRYRATVVSADKPSPERRELLIEALAEGPAEGDQAEAPPRFSHRRGYSTLRTIALRIANKIGIKSKGEI